MLMPLKAAKRSSCGRSRGERRDKQSARGVSPLLTSDSCFTDALL